MCRTTPSTERSLPPYDKYGDKGCEASPGRLGCLSCPLPFCRYDDPVSFRNWQDRKRRALVTAAMQADSLSVAQTAQRFGLTIRTVSRYKANEEDRP